MFRCQKHIDYTYGENNQEVESRPKSDVNREHDLITRDIS